MKIVNILIKVEETRFKIYRKIYNPEPGENSS